MNKDDKLKHLDAALTHEILTEKAYGKGLRYEAKVGCAIPVRI